MSVVEPDTWAMPKSVSSTRSVPSSSSTLAGLRSRCSTPEVWAARSAPSRSTPIRAASAASTGPCSAMRSAREGPSINSRTMYGRSSSSTTSWTTMMFGWLSWARARASRRVRSRRRRASAADSVSSKGSSFTATPRPSSWSVARQTTPMPPRPIRASSRYRPAMTRAPCRSVPFSGSPSVTMGPSCPTGCVRSGTAIRPSGARSPLPRRQDSRHPWRMVWNCSRAVSQSAAGADM